MNIVKKIYKRFIISCVNGILKGTRCFKLKRAMLNSCSGIKIGKGTKIVGPLNLSLISYLSIGENSWIGNSMSIEGNGSVEIGNNCDIAPNVLFVTGSHNIGTSSRRAGEGFNGKIKVSDGCWICARATILSNITIEHGVVIAAGACVVKDVVGNAVYGGVPAKEIKKLETLL